MNKLIYIILIVFFDMSAFGMPDIHFHAKDGRLFQVKELLSKDPNLLELKTKSGRTPLLWAVDTGRVEVIDYLVSCGANIHVVDDYGRGILHYANKPAIIRQFVELGLDVDAENKWGYTPLHKSIDYANPLTARVLLESGADKNKINKGKTFLEYAKDIHARYTASNENLLRRKKTNLEFIIDLLKQPTGKKLKYPKDFPCELELSNVSVNAQKMYKKVNLRKKKNETWQYNITMAIKNMGPVIANVVTSNLKISTMRSTLDAHRPAVIHAAIPDVTYNGKRILPTKEELKIVELKPEESTVIKLKVQRSRFFHSVRINYYIKDPYDKKYDFWEGSLRSKTFEVKKMP